MLIGDSTPIWYSSMFLIEPSCPNLLKAKMAMRMNAMIVETMLQPFE